MRRRQWNLSLQPKLLLGLVMMVAALVIVLTPAISLGAAVLFPIEEAAEKEEKPEAETGGSRV